MADFAQTITNEFQVFGAEPTNEWGTMEWGTDNWGYGTDVVVHVEHILDDTQDLTLTDTQTLLVDFFSPILNNALDMDADMSMETLVDAAGYFHIFTGGVRDAEDRSETAWTDIT